MSPNFDLTSESLTEAQIANIRTYLELASAWLLLQSDKPYIWAQENDKDWENNPGSDCSELSQGYITKLLRAFYKNEYTFLDGAENQYRFLMKHGTPLGPDDKPLPGDLGFIWSPDKSRICHVVICFDISPLTKEPIAIEARGKPYSRIMLFPTYLYKIQFKGRWAGWLRTKEMEFYYRHTIKQ